MREDLAAAALADRLRATILLLARQLRGQVQQHGLTLNRLAVLSALAEATDPLRPSDLAARLTVSAPGISRLIEILEQGGFVSRRPDPADQRACLVSLTGLGRATLVELNRESSRQLGDRVATLEAADRAALVTALPALERLLER